MREAEASAIAAGWTEERLLALAGQRLGVAIGRFFPTPGMAVAFLGKGHNAGDALVALGVLRDRYGWKIAVRGAFEREDCAPLTQMKWRELEASGDAPSAGFSWRNAAFPLVLIDGLLGIGGRGGLSGRMLELADEMRWLRHHAGARVVAVDQPSGVDADTGEASVGCVTADVTFMIGSPKRGLLSCRAVNHVGALALVPVEVLACSGSGDLGMIAPQTMDFGKSHRPFDFHKGMAGHVGIIAGSARYPGAAVMAAMGALRGGAGLVTLYVPETSLVLIASKCPPEIILRSLGQPGIQLGSVRHDAWVVGCGLGNPDPDTVKIIQDVISGAQVPVVIDADGLNLIANLGLMEMLHAQHILTPHPGEFRRLAPDLGDLPREEAVRAFAARGPATLLLKGGRTLVSGTGGFLWCNSTGSPAMATGGQGDLLSGVIGALAAGGKTPTEAACLGAWLCGRAAERALQDIRYSEESLTPSEVMGELGGAFHDWRTSQR